jgi:hypothetical protein
MGQAASNLTTILVLAQNSMATAPRHEASDAHR